MLTDRVLLTLKYLWEESSEENYATGVDIMNYLEDHGIKAPSRNTIYRDIKQLQELGVQIVVYKGTQNHYWIDERVFSTAELQLLTDAVQAAQFISKKRSNEILDKLAVFAEPGNPELLNRRLLIETRPKSTNDNILFVVNELQHAIATKKKVNFQYVDYSPSKKKVFRHNGQVYSVSPYSMLWNGANYYMLGWSDSHGKVVCFRVNRIEKVQVTDVRIVPKPRGYREQDYYSEIFSMYDGPECEVELLCTNDMMNIIIDRFGTGVKTSVMDKDHFKVIAKVHISNVFYGWLCGLAGKVKLISPKSAVDELYELVKMV